MGHGNAMSEICLKSAEKYLKSPIRSFTVGTSRTFFTGRDYLYFFRMSFFFPSFLLHLPLLSAFGCLLGFFFRFHFSASILFLCFSACLLFCFFASLLFFFSASSASCCFFASLLLRFFAFLFFCFFCFFCCFFASLLLRFFVFFFCFSAFCCFFASRLVCFRFSAFLLLWVFLFCFGVCFISLLFCV